MDARDGNRERPVPPPKAWHACPPDEVVLALETSTEQGLPTRAIAERQTRFGANVLHAPEPVRPLAILLAQFTSPLVALLGAAAVVATLLGDLGDGIAIGAIVVLNAIIGFRQEYGAETALAALRKMTAPRARVRREGRAEIVDAASLVPGDLLDLEAGEEVQWQLLDRADLRLKRQNPAPTSRRKSKK